MTVKYSSFEGQASGTTWSVANSGGGSGDAIDTQTGGASAAFSNAQSAHGSLSLLINAASSQGYSSWTGLSLAQVGIRFYLYFVAGVSAAQDIASLTGGPKLQVSATGQLKVIDVAGATKKTFTALSTGTWYRVEMYAAKGTSTTDGTIKAAYYTLDSTTPVEAEYSATNVNAGTANYTAYNWGKLTGGSVALNAHFDDVAFSDAVTTYIGPATVTVTGVTATATATAPVPAVTAAGVVSPPRATATALAPVPTVSGGGTVNSTGRIVRIFGADGAAAGNSTGRIVEIWGSDQGTLVATITGPTELEAGEPFVLTPTATGAGAMSWTWTQTGGPTVTNTGLDNFEGVAPASSTEATLSFEVTGNPGGSTDTHTITVHPASEYRLSNGEWVPYVRYRLVSA